MGFAGVQATARAALHGFMSREASFYEVAGATPETITARRQNAPKLVGDLAGTNLSYAEVQERPTTVILWVAELETAGVEVSRGSLIIFTSTEGWYVDNVMPPDDETVTVEVAPLSDGDLAGKQLPDGSVIGA